MLMSQLIGNNLRIGQPGMFRSRAPDSARGAEKSEQISKHRRRPRNCQHLVPLDQMGQLSRTHTTGEGGFEAKALLFFATDLK